MFVRQYTRRLYVDLPFQQATTMRYLSCGFSPKALLSRDFPLMWNSVTTKREAWLNPMTLKKIHYATATVYNRTKYIQTLMYTLAHLHTNTESATS